MTSRTPSSFRAIAVAIVKGFFRDKASVFFALIFPLMFLVLFGGLFDFDSTSRITVVQVGDVSLVDDLPPGAKEAFDETFEVTRSAVRNVIRSRNSSPRCGSDAPSGNRDS